MLRLTENKSTIWHLLFVSILVLLSYSNVVFAGFISWDDADFTINNKDVQSFNLNAFFSNFYLGNYSPFTMISFSVDYFFGKENTWVYHFHNIILHISNSVLVYILIGKLQDNKRIAFMVALLFAIHPIQCESVSWVSERKNVLCGLFYLLTLLSYISYTKDTSYKKYLLVLFTFLCSLFSKGMAVSLPISLIAIDLWMHRPFLKKNLIEKLPFFIVSFVFGIIAIKAQASASFLKTDANFGFIQNIWFSSYSFMLYVLKIFFPIHLSAIYPYPKTGFNILFIVGFVFFVLFLYVLINSIRKKQNLLAGGLLFFLGNIIFVLQFIAQGAVLMADHYCYIAIIGIIFPVVVLLFKYLKKTETIIPVCSFILIVFLYASYSRNQVWKNNISFWTDIVNKYPNSHIALSSLGSEYMRIGDNVKAGSYLNKAIITNPNYLQGYYNRGLFYAKNNRFEEAISDFTKALSIKNYTKAYVARAAAYRERKEYAKALSDVNFILSYEPNNIKAIYILANCYNDLNELDKALFFYDKIISLAPKEADFYLKKAVVLGKQQRFSACLDYLTICTNLDPNFAEAYYWKGVAKVNLKQNPCSDFSTALSLGFETARKPLMSFCK
jgi:tetratricopeptide (TPR) repeat protein